MLRAYRDSYLSETEERKVLVKEYYEIAPGLVAKIDSRNDRDSIYEGIYTNILNCVSLIKNELNEEALKVYRNMVERIKLL